MHINCLELLAAILALKMFVKGRQGISIMLYLDYTMTVAYINNLGGGSIESVIDPITEPVDVVPGKKHPNNSPPPPWEGESHSR